MTTTTGIVRKSLDRPDEVRKFAGHGYANVAAIAGGPVLRAHFQPGWRWSQDVKPIAGTDSCHAACEFAWTREPRSSSDLVT
jgi:hypothetical protein